jgi:hypothetical protein
MATSGKGGYRNNGRPRVQLRPGLTRVAQLIAALREIRNAAGEVGALEVRERITGLCVAGIEGTYTPSHLKPKTRPRCDCGHYVRDHENEYAGAPCVGSSPSGDPCNCPGLCPE